MKSTIIEGVEYKLTPIKKENKTVYPHYAQKQFMEW